MPKIKTSKDELLKRLRFFNDKSNEMKYIDEYYIHDKFPTEIFKEFIESIESRELILNEKNCESFYKLSSKYLYNELTEQIESFMSTRPDLCKIIPEIFNQEEVEKIDIIKEEIIAKNLDFCLLHGNLNKLPINSLIRIFCSPKRVLHDYHLLFKYILNLLKAKQFYNKNSDRESIEILIGLMDYNEMSNDELEEFVTNDYFRSEINSRNSRERIKKLIEINKINEERLKKIEEEISKINNNEEQIKEEQRQTKIKVQQIEKNQLQINEKYQEELSKSVKLCHLKDFESNQLNHIQEIKEEFGKFQAIIEEHSKKTDQKHIEEEIIHLKEKISNIQNEFNEIIINIPFENEPFSGIFKELTKENGCNIHDAKIIEITGNKNHIYNVPYSILVDFNTFNCYGSSNEENSYLCFDFKFHSVAISAYSIKSSNYAIPAFLKSWNIEGSNDQKEWIILDSHSEDDILCSRAVIKTFKINDRNKSNQYFKYIRLITTGLSSRSVDQFEITNIEFFGKYCRI